MSKLNQPLLWLTGFLLLMGSIPLQATEFAEQVVLDQVRVILPQEAVVESKEYTLGHFAVLEGVDANLSQKLQRIVIGRAPLPGRSLTASKSLIVSRLRPHIDPNLLEFPGNIQTTIHRAALRVPGEDIEHAVKDYIQQQMDLNDYKVKILSPVRDIFLPKGELAFDVKPLGNHKKEGGNRTYKVSFRIDGKDAKTVTVRTYIKVYKQVVMARHTIKANQRIQPTDLVIQRRNVDRLPQQYITDATSLVGQVAKRAINPKEVFKQNAVEAPAVISRGDTLQIVFETQGLRLSAPGVALDKGAIGQKISVRNIKSNKVVFAQVINRNEAKVF